MLLLLIELLKEITYDKNNLTTRFNKPFINLCVIIIKSKDMKRILSILIVGLFLISGSGTALADHHRHYKFGSGYTEYRHSKHHDDDDDYKKHFKKQREKEKKYYKKQREREKKYYKKVYGHKHRHYDHDKQLRKMIRYAARGGRDVHVWRVSDDTYVVKYYRGGHYYTQRLYPYTGRYGSRGIINVNWSPESYWTLLPSININIPIN